MLSVWQQVARDRLLWSYGYFQGRSIVLPRNFTELHALVISKLTSFAALPLPLLSFLALPVFGGTSTSFSLLVFYLSWSSLVFSHDPLSLEIYGTLAVRIIFFLLPALGFLAADIATPSLSKSAKAYGEKNLPLSVANGRLVKITGVAVFNVLLQVALQAALEVLCTEFLALSRRMRMRRRPATMIESTTKRLRQVIRIHKSRMSRVLALTHAMSLLSKRRLSDGAGGERRGRLERVLACGAQAFEYEDDFRTGVMRRFILVQSC